MAKVKTSKEFISLCCKADVFVEGRTTKYFVCTECGRPCDITGKELMNGTNN